MDGRGEDLHKMFAAGNEKYLQYVKCNFTLHQIIYLKIFIVNQKYFPTIKNFRPT